MYLQPIKNNDPQLDFYTIYKRETVEHDAEYLQKYDEDLNTTLIFVRFLGDFSTDSVDRVFRLVCSLQSAPPSSSTSNRNSSRTQANGQKPTSGRFFSASTDPLFRTKTPPLLRPGTDHLKRSSRPRLSCMQACSSRCWPHLSRCGANSG